GTSMSGIGPEAALPHLHPARALNRPERTSRREHLLQHVALTAAERTRSRGGSHAATPTRRHRARRSLQPPPWRPDGARASRSLLRRSDPPEAAPQEPPAAQHEHQQEQRPRLIPEGPVLTASHLDDRRLEERDVQGHPLGQDLRPPPG